MPERQASFPSLLCGARRRRVLIIGAGAGGICMAIKLLGAGHRDFLVLEKAAGLGGTWWYNRYPGAACDVPSHLYSFSFEVKRDWSNPYASAPEILDYLAACADKYQLVSHLRFDTLVQAARWDDGAALWQVDCAGGERFEAEILIAAQSMFNEPSWPTLPGRENFRGVSFHTARWDHDHDLGGSGSASLAARRARYSAFPKWRGKRRS